MISNLNLKGKLIVALLIPIFGLMYFTFQTGASDLNKQKKLIQLKAFLDDSIQVSDLVHEIQKERGLSAGFIGARGKRFKIKLINQRKVTDKKITKLIKHLKTYNSNNKFDINNAIKQLNSIKKIRKQVDIQNITFKEILKYYSIINDEFLNFISNFSLISNNDKISQMGIAYINLLRAKEASGIERAILSNVFASGKMNSKTYREFSILYASHQTYINSYKSLIDEQQLLNFNKKMSDNNVADVERLREIAFSKVMKDKIISDIKEMAGYGGLIHSFKNYVLRGDKKYAVNFKNNYKNIQLLFKQYKDMPTTTDTEKVLIDIIADTFYKYNLGLTAVVKAHNMNQPIKDLDKIVKVNDSPAIDAINTLSHNILGANATYWFKVATQRINILKKVEDEFVHEMLNKMDIFSQDIKNKSTVNFMIFIIIIITLFILSIKIIYDTTHSMKKFQKGLMNFFSYLTDKSQEVKPILINSTDEFGQMAIVINKNIKKTKKHLDEKVQKEILKNKEKDQILFQQSKMASMGEMIGNIAHQWRQPLTIISSASSGMQVHKEFGTLDDDNFNEFTNAINTSTEYLTRTIDDFSDFFKSDKKENKFYIQDAINKDLSIIEKSYESLGITIIQSIDSIELYTYENELSQALLNILKNAKDALVQNIKTKKFIFIDAKKSEDKMVLSIKDNANGIPKDIIDKIFEPYFTTKHQSQGTGIGLFMTQEIIIKNLGGSLTVTNQDFDYEGENYTGAQFTITLPLS